MILLNEQLWFISNAVTTVGILLLSDKLYSRQHIQMSKDEQADNLCYGQGILLRGFKDNKDDIGFLTAKGFADTTAKYETFKNILFFKNYRNTIFQIVPAANFEINDELRKVQEITQEENTNVRILKARAASEEEQFNLNIENRMQQQVCFGDTVIFKHVDSDTYLSGTIRPSSGENGAFTVEVTKNLSDILVFKVLPFRSYERIGMPIPFDSPVKLLNTYNNGYLTFEKIGLSNAGKKKEIDLDKKLIDTHESFKIPVKTNSADTEVYECVTHFVDLSMETEDPMPWQFMLHMNEVENDSLIQHDIIYFEHTENGGILSTEKTDIILKEMKNEGADQLPFYECLWEIEKHDETPDAYILRHLMSGMTLGIRTDLDGKPLKPELFDISDGEAEAKLGWVELKLAKKEVAVINSDRLINICYQDWCLDKAKDTAGSELQEEEGNGEDYINISRLNKMSVDELEYETKNVKFTLQISKNCFVIHQIPDELKKQVLFALSFHSKIIDLRQDLKEDYIESEKKIEYLRIMQVTEKIKEIKDFLKNCPKELSDRDYIKPIYKRQMICKDLGISELLFELLHFMHENQKRKYEPKNKNDPPEKRQPYYIFEKKQNELEKFEELYNSIYEVIYELVRNNLLFKIYVSKWINFVIRDVVRQNQPSHLMLLKELLRDNEFLVKYHITDHAVQKLSSDMLDQRGDIDFNEKKYLEIFRLLCIVGEKINTANQIKILNHYIKQLRTNDMYQISLLKKDDEIWVDASIDKSRLKKRRFGDYYKICKEEYITAWEYFVEFLNLCADMTRGRNKTVEGYLETMFTQDILTELFENYQLYESEVPVIRLLHNLHAENERYYPIERKKRISEWEKLRGEEVDIIQTTSELKPWNSPLKRVLACLKDKLQKDYGPIDPKEFQKNSNLYEILNFIWETLNLGFWQKKEQVKELFKDLNRILEPHEAVTADYEAASIETKENLLMMKCKLECMNIIQLILDYDLDLDVRYICKHFQVFELPPKKRKLIEDEGSRLLEYKVDNELAVKFIQQLPKDYMQLVDVKILQRMIELAKYRNSNLTSQSISIMERVLLKKKKAIQDFCQQIFVCGAQRAALKSFIEQKKNKFCMMQDQTLVNVTMATQGGNYVFIYNEDNRDSGIMQDIFMMSEALKNEYVIERVDLFARQIRSLEASGQFKKFGTSRLINFTDERTSSNAMKQSVLDAQNIHVFVLEFVLNCREVPSQDLALKLLHLSYKFLVSLIWNYQDIKPSLIKYVPQLFPHLKQNVGSIDFFKEMYDNNKAMLFNEAAVVKLIKEICSIIDAQPPSSFYKAKLLDFFRFLIYCNNKTLKFNQIQILKVMQDDSYKHILLEVTHADITRLAGKYCEDIRAKSNDKNEKGEKNEKVDKSLIKMDPELLYMVSYFQIMESLIDDRNSVNMGKLKKRFPFDTLVDWVEASEECYPLKRNIRAFLNRLYYFEPEVEIYMKKIIGSELHNIIYDLNRYILTKETMPHMEAAYFEDPVRFSYAQSYLYLNLQENLFTLYELTTRQKIMEEMKIILHPVEKGENDGPFNFIRICERLGCIKSLFVAKKNTFTNSFIKFLLKKFKDIIDEFDDSIFEKGIQIPDVVGRAPTKPEKERARTGLIDKIMTGNINTFYTQNLVDQYEGKDPLVFSVMDKGGNPKDDKKPNQNKLLNKLRQILKREKRAFKDEDEAVDYKLTRLVRAIKLSPEASGYLVADYNHNLSDYSSSPDIFKYIETIIAMNSLNSEALPIKEKQFFLNLVSGIIDQNNTVDRADKLKPIDEWESQDWVASKDQLTAIQTRLKKCQLGRFVTELLKENIADNIEFADSILLCGISYLFGGNTNSQKNIIEEIQADKDNKVMRNLDNLISKLGKFILKNIEESRREEADPDNKFSTTTIDNYDFFDVEKRYVWRKNVFEPQTTDEEIYSKTCMRTYKRAFKFLQLLCENNNVEGKKFIKEQPEVVKNFNFIDTACKEVRNLFISLNQEICDVTMFLLDFILEVTQIPVYQNQAALMDLSFFEDVCALQNTFSKPENVSLKGFEGREHLIEDIYFKTIQIILSNFEGNDLNTFKAIDAKLEPRFLDNVLKKKLQDMGLRVKEDVIAYIDRMKECTFDKNMMSVLNILIIFKKLQEKLDESRVCSIYNKTKDANAPMFDYLEACLLTIEINNNRNEKQLVTFPKYPVFASLSGSLRDTVMDIVDRSTHRSKIVSLLSYTGSVKRKIESSYSLLKVEGISEKNMNDAFTTSAVMSIVLCFYMMTYYDVIINYQEADYSSSRVIGLVRFALSLVQLSMSMVYGYFWIRFKIWEVPQKTAQEAPKPPAEDEVQKGLVARVIERVKKVLALLRIDIVINYIKEALISLLVVLRGGDTTQPLYYSPQFYRMALYVAVAFFGTFFHPALFFLHLMDIFCYIPEIGDIFKAIGINIKELALVCFMGIVFTFVFCTVTFSNYQKNIYDSESAEEEMCQSMMDCIFKLFVSGAIGESMEGFEIVRYSYDMVYFIFFEILFGNIVSGIMLDAFGALRERNDGILEDKQNYCYITNISRETLEKKRISFYDHITGPNFLWNYVFFVYFLNDKPATDYSGLESQIVTQYNGKSEEDMKIDWVPTAEEEPYDCRAELESLNELVGGKLEEVGAGQGELSQAVKDFREIAGELAA